MTTIRNEEKVAELRAKHEAILKVDNDLLSDAAVAVRKELYRLQPIDETHCQSCGAVVGKHCGEFEGYTSCCNEIAVRGGCDARHCFH